MSYATTHADALAKVRVKGQRITFTRTDRSINNDTGEPGAPVVTTVRGYALGLEKGDPNTYAKLGLVFSSAPTLFVVCDTYGATPPDLATCEWGGAVHTVRDVKPFAPNGVPLTFEIVVAR
ncbi:hypothetical protein [Gemmatimonas sp.]|uniref:hypothetical protein n=1 Tax=Gemmatimonas sp. TaxID=1962908 RepID=UPI0033428284